MKYFSEKLNKAYDTQAELIAAENAYDAAKAGRTYNNQTTSSNSSRAKKQDREFCCGDFCDDCCSTECCLKCNCDACSCADCSCCSCL